MPPLLLGVILVADCLLLLVIAISVFFPKSRIWPPHEKGSWQQWLSWTLFTLVMFGVPLIGVLDFHSLGVDYFVEFIAGGFLFALGLAIDLWGTKTLSAQQSMGATGKIITAGPYRYTRNPQYVGFIILFGGIIMLTASWMALATGLFAILLFFVIPFSEEPWLKEQYGKPYEEYCRMVPRFVGVRSFKPTLPSEH